MLSKNPQPRKSLVGYLDKVTFLLANLVLAVGKPARTRAVINRSSVIIRVNPCP